MNKKVALLTKRCYFFVKTLWNIKIKNIMKKYQKKAWAVTDWNGKINNLSVSIFDTKKEAEEQLKYLNKLPEPKIKGKNKIICVEVKEI